MTGGSSHVTSAVGSGPGGLADDWWHRLEISYRSVTSDHLTTVLWIVDVNPLEQMAGPGATFRVNGFTGGRLPPKSQIRQIRFRMNSFDAEYHEGGGFGVVLDAFLVAIAVSLLFNDSPNDVARFGVLAATTLWAWLRVDLTAAGRVH